MAIWFDDSAASISQGCVEYYVGFLVALLWDIVRLNRCSGFYDVY